MSAGRWAIAGQALAIPRPCLLTVNEPWNSIFTGVKAGRRRNVFEVEVARSQTPVREFKQ